jgi:hypothetical protein
MKAKHLSFTILALLAVAIPAAAQSQPSTHASQTSLSADWTAGGVSEEPPTTKMRVENLRRRHAEAITELTSAFGRIPNEPQLVSSKEVIDAVDKGDRAMKRTKTACDAILDTLRGESKTIKAETSFRDDQKVELLAAVDTMAAECDQLAAQAVSTMKHLGGAYKAMAKWRKVYKTYLDLDGAPKAGNQLKAAVDDYVQGLTVAPAPAESTPTEPAPANPPAQATSN